MIIADVMTEEMTDRDNRNQGGRDDRRKSSDVMTDVTTARTVPAIPAANRRQGTEATAETKEKVRMTFKKKDKDFRHDEDRVGKGKKAKNEPKTQLQKPAEERAETGRADQIISYDSRGSDDSGTCR